MNKKNILRTMVEANTDIYNAITEFCLTDDDLASINRIRHRFRDLAYTLLSISENICDEQVDKRIIITDSELMI